MLSRNFYLVGEADNKHHNFLCIKYFKNKNKVEGCVRETGKK